MQDSTRHISCNSFLLLLWIECYNYLRDKFVVLENTKNNTRNYICIGFDKGYNPCSKSVFYEAVLLNLNWFNYCLYIAWHSVVVNPIKHAWVRNIQQWPFYNSTTSINSWLGIDYIVILITTVATIICDNIMKTKFGFSFL